MGKVRRVCHKSTPLAHMKGVLGQFHLWVLWTTSWVPRIPSEINMRETRGNEIGGVVWCHGVPQHSSHKSQAEGAGIGLENLDRDMKL